MAVTCVALGHYEAAVRLIGASEAILLRIRLHLHPLERRDLEEALTILHTQLDRTQFETLHEWGMGLSPEEAIAYALELGRE